LKTDRRIARLRAAVVGNALVCAGCAGTLDDPARFLTSDGGSAADVDAGSCPDIPSTVFSKTCATAGCHTTADLIQGLDLESPLVASRLVGICARGGGLLVDPSNPAQSVLYLKLTIAPPFGSRMPLGKPPLDDATLACVLNWISAQTGLAGDCTDGGAAPDSAGTDSARE
jgi:hypothetical protein